LEVIIEQLGLVVGEACTFYRDEQEYYNPKKQLSWLIC